MRLLDYFLGKPTSKRAQKLSELESMFALTGSRSSAGTMVSERTAWTHGVVYACVRTIAESLAALPIHAYRKTDGSIEPLEYDHPATRLLREPSPESTSQIFRETLVAHALISGNGYAEIVRSRSGNPLALYTIHPSRMSVHRTRENQEIYYRYQPPTGPAIHLPPSSVFHLPAMSDDGISGVSPIRVAAESIGISLAAEGYGASFFSEGSRPTGVLSTDKILDDDAYVRMRTSWEATHTGKARVAILEEGTKFAPMSIPPDEAQFLETRRFQVEDIARIYRVPPHLVGDLSRATFSNIEHQGISFVAYTLQPWATRIELEADRKLFSGEDRRRGCYTRHRFAALLRGDTPSRYQAYSVALQNGFLSIDEVRAYEELSPLPDGAGSRHRVPLNLAEVTPQGTAIPAAPAPKPKTKPTEE